MFEDASAEVVSLLNYLLPGLLAAWIFYGLTCHPKPGQFERVVQALIFTFIVKAGTISVRYILEWVGGYFSLGTWNQASETIASLILGAGLGIVFAYLTNKDLLFSWLRRKNLTSRTSHPSEWFGVLSTTVTYVVLQLRDGRRLYGWPKEWPLDSQRGEFYIQDPAWIDSEENAYDVGVDGILIPANEVKWVEFLGADRSNEHDQSSPPTQRVEPAASAT